MKYTKIAFLAAALALVASPAFAVTTEKCWPSKGNWVNAATKSCEIISSNHDKKKKHEHECEHEGDDTNPKAL